MAKLDIKIGASVDRNLAVAYKPIVDAAKKAAAAIEAEKKQSARKIEKTAKDAAKAEAKAYADAVREIQKYEREIAREKSQAKKTEEKAFRDAERAKTKAAREEAAERKKIAREEAQAVMKEKREQLKAQRAEERRIKQAIRDDEKAMRIKLRESRDNEQRKDRLAGQFVSGIAGVGRMAARAAMRIAGDVARGAGMNLDIASMFQQNMQLETMAQALSNSAFQPGSARNGRRVDKRELMDLALNTGSSTGSDANTVMEGLQKFVAKTGDLATGRDILKDLSIYAKATGTEFDHMADMAGDIATALPDGEDKGKRVLAVVRAIAGQGKLGAVEVKDLASQMAKIASQAGQFSGDQAHTIAELGAMAQVSRARGGSSSATQAAQSISSWVQMLKTPKRAKEFEKATGAKVFDEKTGMLRSSRDIIKEALEKVGMDPIKLKTVFQNAQGSRAMEGFATLFHQAGGGKAGLAAVDAEFDKLMAAAISEGEIIESFSRAMKTGQSQAEVFNNEMRKAALEMQTALLPAIMAMAPALVDLTKDMAKALKFIFGDKETERRTGQVFDDVTNQIASSRKQIAGGQISEATLKNNAIVEADAKAVAEKAKQELEEKNKKKFSETDRAFMKMNDYGPGGILLSLLSGNKIGDGMGTAMVQKQDEELRQAGFNEKNAREAFERMHATNEIIKSKMEQGLVVRIANVDELKNAMGGQAGPGGAGRSDTPEDKAADR